VCARRLLARSGYAALSALVLTAAFAPVASAKAPAFQRDETPLPAQLSNPASKAAIHSASAGGALARTIVGLGIVLAVVFGIYWLLKTYGKSKSTTTGDGRMEIVATTALAPNRALHLVRVGDGFVLVGSAEGGVTRVRAYSPEETELLQAQLDGENESFVAYNSAQRPAPAPAKGLGFFMAAFNNGAMIETLRRRTARR
jgi:flagellar protein FliO/FliZ